MKIIDISQELFTCRVYPGDLFPSYERVKTVESDKYNLTNLTMCVHNGTHIDAPKHFIADGKAVHELDLTVFYGECTIVEFDGFMNMSDLLKTCHKRLLIKGDYEMSVEEATLIANSHVGLIGVESQSVGSINHPLDVHITLLEKGIIPLEGLNLSGVMPGEYILAAFPLNLYESDGSPVRAVLIEE